MSLLVAGPQSRRRPSNLTDADLSAVPVLLVRAGMFAGAPDVIDFRHRLPARRLSSYRAQPVRRRQVWDAVMEAASPTASSPARRSRHASASKWATAST
jgi:hypothetical protein